MLRVNNLIGFGARRTDGAAAIPVVESSTEANSGTGSTTSLVINKPAGVASGDLLVIGAVCRRNGAYTAPTDFNTLFEESQNGPDTAVFWKIADGTEGSTFTIGNDRNEQMVACCVRISGVNATTPIEDYSYVYYSDADAQANSSGTVTTTSSTLLLAFGAWSGDSAKDLNAYADDYTIVQEDGGPDDDPGCAFSELDGVVGVNDAAVWTATGATGGRIVAALLGVVA